MKWVTWEQAAVAVVICAIAVFALRRMRPTRVGDALLPAFRELGFTAFLYALWRIARELPLTNDDGAIERARSLVDIQNALLLPSEQTLQQWVVGREWLEWTANAYYAIVHVPITIGFLIWMFVRHRSAYARWRTALAISTAFCLVIRYQRVAPPRFFPELGFVDLGVGTAFDVYGPQGSGVSDQFAAMPSIHAAWAAVVTFGAISVLRSRWRWLWLLHLAATTWAVTVTAHHWWLDDIVAFGLVGLALLVDGQARKRWPITPGWRSEPAAHTAVGDPAVVDGR